MSVIQSFGPTSNAYLKGNFSPQVHEEEFNDLRIEGIIPPELNGKMLIRTGPNPRFKPRDMKYYHWFDGDGMMNAFYFENGKVRYKNRFVQTKKWKLEDKAGKALFGGIRSGMSTSFSGWIALKFGFFNLLKLGVRTILGKGPNRSQYESIASILNAANTNVLKQGDRLLALDEIGQPYEINADMQTIGIYNYENKLKGPSIAHPLTDFFTNETFTMGYNALPPFFQYYKIDAAGKIISYEPIDVPYGVMMHAFGLSENFVMFYHMPALFDIKNVGTREPFRWMPEKGARLGVMPRNGKNSDVKWFEIPLCWVFHNMNMYEEGDWLVTDVAKYSRIPLLDLGTENPSPPFSLDPVAILVRWRLNRLTGELKEEILTEKPVEFPNMDERFATKKHAHGYYVRLENGEQNDGLWNTLIHHNFETGKEQRYWFGEDCYTGEAVFTPKHADSPEGEGYLMNVVYDTKENKSRLTIFDAMEVDKGPIATVHLPRRIEYDFHGNIVEIQKS
ncbi:carotenoid oxygenase family protein [Algoriphagus boritolerans]|nr:carotenoid oxygenase family protein [Algoriphagus boritolerans]